MTVDELVDAYRRRPQLAAVKALHHQQRALAAQARGAHDDAVDHYDAVDRYHHVLDVLVRCRRCGRRLTNMDSIMRKIGPECAGKHSTDTCVICGGKGTMAVPDDVLGGYIDVDCFCQERPRPDNAARGSATDPGGAKT